MRLETQSFGHVYCVGCRTLFMGLVALRFSHPCEANNALVELNVIYPKMIRVIRWPPSQKKQTFKMCPEGWEEDT